MEVTTVLSVEEDVAWIQRNFSIGNSTESSSTFAAEDNAIITIVVVAIAVFVTIMLLFGLAVFIDCRHQKKSNADCENQRRSVSSLFGVPNFFKFARFSNEEDVDKMYNEN